MSSTPEQLRAYRRSLIDGRFCINGMSHGPAIFKQLCAACALMRQKARKKHRAKRIKDKICVNAVSHGPAMAGDTRCQKCVDRQKSFNSKNSPRKRTDIEISNSIRRSEELATRNICITAESHGPARKNPPSEYCQFCLDRLKLTARVRRGTAQRSELVAFLKRGS